MEIIRLAGVDMTSPDFAESLIVRCNAVSDLIKELLKEQ